MDAVAAEGGMGEPEDVTRVLTSKRKSRDSLVAGVTVKEPGRGARSLQSPGARDGKAESPRATRAPSGTFGNHRSTQRKFGIFKAGKFWLLFACAGRGSNPCGFSKLLHDNGFRESHFAQ